MWTVPKYIQFQADQVDCERNFSFLWDQRDVFLSLFLLSDIQQKIREARQEVEEAEKVEEEELMNQEQTILQRRQARKKVNIFKVKDQNKLKFVFWGNK